MSQARDRRLNVGRRWDDHSLPKWDINNMVTKDCERENRAQSRPSQIESTCKCKVFEVGSIVKVLEETGHVLILTQGNTWICRATCVSSRGQGRTLDCVDSTGARSQ